MNAKLGIFKIEFSNNTGFRNPVDCEGTLYLLFLAFKHQETVEGDIKTVVEEREDKETGKIIEITTKFQVITKKVSQVIANRKNWKKFGESKYDGVGPNVSTTFVAEEVAMDFLPRQLEQEKTVEAKKSTVATPHVRQFLYCRNCKTDDHKTLDCPYNEEYKLLQKLEEDLNPESEQVKKQDEKPQVKLGIYIPPGKRAELSGQVSDIAKLREQREMREQHENETTLRVLNLPENYSEIDVKKLFSMGKSDIIMRVRITQSGMTFVVFKEKADAEKALKKFDKYTIDYLKLNVDWAR